MGPNDALNPSVTVAGESTCITGADTGIAVIGSNAASRSSLVLESGTIEGGSFGIAGNGTCDNTNIEIKGGIVRSTSQDVLRHIPSTGRRSGHFGRVTPRVRTACS